MEDCFRRDGKANTCLCLKDKNQVGLLCYEAASVNKECNFPRHFDTEHTKVSPSEKQKMKKKETARGSKSLADVPF